MKFTLSEGYVIIKKYNLVEIIMTNAVRLRNVNENNLKDIDADIPCYRYAVMEYRLK